MSTEQTPAGSAAALHILLIEDNEDAAAMLTQVLEMSGHTVTVAGDGQSGLAKARQDEPDLILCDLGLPGGTSGLDVARELRSDERLADVPMIAMSGFGRAEDKAQSEAAGFDAHLTKPIDLPTLERTMAGVTGLDQP